MNARALLYTIASLCFTFAVTQIPFAETYSLAFTSTATLGGTGVGASSSGAA